MNRNKPERPMTPGEQMLAMITVQTYERQKALLGKWRLIRRLTREQAKRNERSMRNN